MRFLIISFCFLILSCGSYQKQNDFKEASDSIFSINNLYFSNPQIDYVYKAQIDIYDKHFSGLLIIKKIGDNTHRLAFTTEMGNKLFDFTFTEVSFKVNYIVDEFDKSLLIKILKEDFKALITENLSSDRNYKKDDNSIYQTLLFNKKHYYSFKNSYLSKITRVKGSKEKVSFQFSNISDTIAKQIQITHYNIKLKIILNSIIKL